MSEPSGNLGTKTMNRVIRAKIKINQAESIGRGGSHQDFVKGGEQIHAAAVYSEDKTTENYAFSVATPSLSLNMFISNPDAFGLLVRDKEYYLDFTPVEERLETDAEKEARGHSVPPATEAVRPDRMLRWFEYSHLPPHLQEVSKPFGDLANAICESLIGGPERTVALRKLLEAKDAAVRAKLTPGG